MRWGMLVMLTSCVLAACATTQSPENQRRISDCLAGCKVAEAPPRTGPFDQNAGQLGPQPNTCEQSCAAMK